MPKDKEILVTPIISEGKYKHFTVEQPPAEDAGADAAGVGEAPQSEQTDPMALALAIDAKAEDRIQTYQDTNPVLSQGNHIDLGGLFATNRSPNRKKHSDDYAATGVIAGLPYSIIADGAPKKNMHALRDLCQTELPKKLPGFLHRVKTQGVQAAALYLAEEIKKFIYDYEDTVFCFALQVQYRDDAGDLKVAGFNVGSTMVAVKRVNGEVDTLSPAQWIGARNKAVFASRDAMDNPRTGDAYHPLNNNLANIVRPFEETLQPGDRVYGLTDGAYEFLPTRRADVTEARAITYETLDPTALRHNTEPFSEYSLRERNEALERCKDKETEAQELLESNKQLGTLWEWIQDGTVTKANDEVVTDEDITVLAATLDVELPNTVILRSKENEKAVVEALEPIKQALRDPNNGAQYQIGDDYALVVSTVPTEVEAQAIYTAQQARAFVDKIFGEEGLLVEIRESVTSTLSYLAAVFPNLAETTFKDAIEGIKTTFMDDFTQLQEQLALAITLGECTEKLAAFRLRFTEKLQVLSNRIEVFSSGIAVNNTMMNAEANLQQTLTTLQTTYATDHGIQASVAQYQKQAQAYMTLHSTISGENPTDEQAREMSVLRARKAKILLALHTQVKALQPEGVATDPTLGTLKEHVLHQSLAIYGDECDKAQRAVVRTTARFAVTMASLRSYPELQAYYQSETGMREDILGQYKLRDVVTAKSREVSVNKRHRYHRDEGVPLLLRHWVEHNDALHRTWRSVHNPALEEKYDEWERSMATGSLQEVMDPHRDLDQDHRIIYYDEAERQAYLTHPNWENKLVHGGNEAAVLENGDYIYAMSLTGDFYVGEEGEVDATGIVRRQHSSFLAGDNVVCAGALTITDGKISHITTGSGHYIPDMHDLAVLLDELEYRGVLSADLTINTDPPTVAYPKIRSLSAFRAELAKTPLFPSAKPDKDMLKRHYATLIRGDRDGEFTIDETPLEQSEQFPFEEIDQAIGQVKTVAFQERLKVFRKDLFDLKNSGRYPDSVINSSIQQVGQRVLSFVQDSEEKPNEFRERNQERFDGALKKFQEKFTTQRKLSGKAKLRDQLHRLCLGIIVPGLNPLHHLYRSAEMDLHVHVPASFTLASIDRAIATVSVDDKAWRKSLLSIRQELTENIRQKLVVFPDLLEQADGKSVMRSYPFYEKYKNLPEIVGAIHQAVEPFDQAIELAGKAKNSELVEDKQLVASLKALRTALIQDAWKATQEGTKAVDLADITTIAVEAGVLVQALKLNATDKDEQVQAIKAFEKATCYGSKWERYGKPIVRFIARALGFVLGAAVGAIAGAMIGSVGGPGGSIVGAVLGAIKAAPVGAGIGAGVLGVAGAGGAHLATKRGFFRPNRVNRALKEVAEVAGQVKFRAAASAAADGAVQGESSVISGVGFSNNAFNPQAGLGSAPNVDAWLQEDDAAKFYGSVDTVAASDNGEGADPFASDNTVNQERGESADEGTRSRRSSLASHGSASG